MKPSEASEIIEATKGMFHQIALESLLNRELLGYGVETSVVQYYDPDANDFCTNTNYYYTVKTGEGIHEMKLVGIRSVCNFVIDEWPSPQARRVREWLFDAYSRCSALCEGVLEKFDMYIATEEDTELHSFGKQRRGSPRSVRIFLIDTLHEMRSTLNLTEERKNQKKPPLASTMWKFLTPEDQKRLCRQYRKSEQVLVDIMPFFHNNEDAAREFLAQIQGLESTMITSLVRELAEKENNPGLKTKKFYDVLYKHKLYTKTYSNWNGQMGVSKRG